MGFELKSLNARLYKMPTLSTPLMGFRDGGDEDTAFRLQLSTPLMGFWTHRARARERTDTLSTPLMGFRPAPTPGSRPGPGTFNSLNGILVSPEGVGE